MSKLKGIDLRSDLPIDSFLIVVRIYGNMAMSNLLKAIKKARIDPDFKLSVQHLGFVLETEVLQGFISLPPS